MPDRLRMGYIVYYELVLDEENGGSLAAILDRIGMSYSFYYELVLDEEDGGLRR